MDIDGLSTGKLNVDNPDAFGADSRDFGLDLCDPAVFMSAAQEHVAALTAIADGEIAGEEIAGAETVEQEGAAAAVIISDKIAPDNAPAPNKQRQGKGRPQKDSLATQKRASAGLSASPRRKAEGAQAKLSAATTRQPNVQLLQVPLGQVQARTGQPRKAMQPAALAELTRSIRAVGVLQPILVRPVPSQSCGGATNVSGETEGQSETASRYEIIAGERRWQASQKAGLKNVPILIQQCDDELTEEIALVENLQRENLPPLDMADALARMQAQGHSIRKLADRIGKKKGWVEQYIALVHLPADLRELVSGRPDTLTHVRELEKVADPVLRTKLIAEVQDEKHPLPLAELRRRIRKEAALGTPAGKKAQDAAPVSTATDVKKEHLAGDGLEIDAASINALDSNARLEVADAETLSAQTDVTAEASDPAEVGGLGKVGLLETSDADNDGGATTVDAALRQKTLEAKLRTLTRELSKLGRPADPAIRAEMTQLLQDAQIALVATLERWAL